MSLHHQTKITTELLGTVNICFISTGPSNNLDLQVTEAWVEVEQSSTVVTLNEALARTRHNRTAMVDLDRRLFPMIRLNAWDDMLDQAQQDRDPSMNARQAAE